MKSNHRLKVDWLIGALVPDKCPPFPPNSLHGPTVLILQSSQYSYGPDNWVNKVELCTHGLKLG